MARARAAFAASVVLIAANPAPAQTDGKETGKTDATEAAKRELQQLPATQSPVESVPGSSLFRGSSAVPALSLGTPAAPQGPASRGDEKDEAPIPTGGWLLDGMDRLEAEENSQQRAADRDARGGKSVGPEGGRRAGGEAGNPFSEYLSEWLSPRDRALLGGQPTAPASATGTWETRRSDLDVETRATAGGAGSGEPGSGVLNDFSPNSTGANPYLDDSVRSDFSSARPAPAPSGGSEDATTLPAILIPSQTVLPPAAPEPAAQVKPAPVVAPTERLIDDRKYFPQLRRF